MRPRTWKMHSCSNPVIYRLLNVKAPVGTFNKEKVLVWPSPWLRNLRELSFPALIQMQPHHYSFIARVHCSLHLDPSPLADEPTMVPWSEGKLHHLGWSIQTQLEAQFEASMQTMKCSMPTFLCSGPNEKWGWKQEREKSSHMTPDHTSKAPCPHTVSQNTLMLCSVSWLALLSSTHTVKFLFL